MSVARASERVELLEREESVASLGALLDGVRSSREGRLALVDGEAALGKTALTLRQPWHSPTPTMCCRWAELSTSCTP